RRNQVFKELAASISLAGSDRVLAQMVFTAIERAIGPCSCLLRPLDRGDGVEVLRSLAVSDPTWEACPALLRKGEALAGKVWERMQKCVYEDAANDSLLLQIVQEGPHT